mgnify:CR=1 FL=1|tara:strand:- start:5540 stop:6754 length:1215 start_codon:yes stop_codon:yes gene_type:complete
MANSKTTSDFVSDRANLIQASITMTITALANQLRKEGKDVIGMSAGEPDFDTPDSIKKAGIDSINQGKTKYTPAAGTVELKQAVVNKLKQDQGLDYDLSEVIISAGAKHSIFNALMAVLNPGDEVIIPTPYWVSYPDQVNVLGGKSVFVETTDVNKFKITPDQLRAAITSKTKVFILNTPSNPTGMVYTRSELEALGKVIEESGILVISDEIYEKLIYNGEHVSIATLSDKLKEQTILINGVSKAYSMTGWRIGYTAASKEIVGAMSRIQSHSTSNPAQASQWASVEALEGPQDAVDEMRTAFAERRSYMIQRLNAIPGISCVEPDGAFYAFPNISETFGKASESGQITNAVEFCQNLLQEQLVACVPGSGFGAEGFVRLSYATSMDAITKALDRIEAFVHSLK